MISQKDMNKAQTAHENAGYREIDKRAEAQDILEAKIDELKEILLKDDSECERLIEENSDIVFSVMKNGKDTLDKLMCSLECWAEDEARRFYEGK